MFAAPSSPSYFHLVLKIESESLSWGRWEERRGELDSERILSSFTCSQQIAAISFALWCTTLSLSLSLYLYLSLTINLSSFSLFFISFRSLLHFCLIHFKCLLKDRVYLSLCLYLVPFLSIYLTKSLNLSFYLAASYLLLKAYPVHAYPHLWMYKAYLFCYF